MAETVYCNSEKRRIHGKGLTEILSAGVSGSFYGIILKVSEKDCRGNEKLRSTSDFMHFMEYRNMILEEKIEECLTAAQRGASEVTFDREDLTV